MGAVIGGSSLGGRGLNGDGIRTDWDEFGERTPYAPVGTLVFSHSDQSQYLGHEVESRFMIEFLEAHWGDVASVSGIIVSAVGLYWAIRLAGGAKSAADETRDQMARHLQTVDVMRAIGLINRVKILHLNEQWVASYEHYQTLREMLSYVIARCPDEADKVQEKLSTGRAQIRVMENSVNKIRSDKVIELKPSSFNEQLNEIQSDLEELASSLSRGEWQGETR